MAYTIHRLIILNQIRTESSGEVSGSSADTSPESKRSERVAEFSNQSSAKLSGEIDRCLALDQLVSVAINDKGQLIAVVNHITGKHGKVPERMRDNLRGIFKALAFIFPIVMLGSFMIRKAIPYFNAAIADDWFLLSGGIVLCLFALMLLKLHVIDHGENAKALRELLRS